MPPPTDPVLRQKCDELYDATNLIPENLAEDRHGIRPVHAKGTLFTGLFIPTPQAAEVTTAWHFQGGIVPITVRFSAGSHDRGVEDTDDSAQPTGFAIRFVEEWKPTHRHTDIITQSVDGFPVSTAEEAFDYFDAIRLGIVEEYMRTNPKAAAYGKIPKPTPRGFGTQKYYGVNAYKFVGPKPERKERYFRYRIVPRRGVQYLDDQDDKTKLAAKKRRDFLEREMVEYLETSPVFFTLVAQMAEEGDVTNDCTVKWGDDREEIELGTIQIECLACRQQLDQKHMIFDPIPRIAGIEPSDDPLLELRAGVYLKSGTDRRKAEL
ncbi:catalase-like domain-containing protein [Hypoxylon sp. FL1150]|nr:catalase-like domain-containing protein [Hypoxylon sp. FL1150]